jgi:hypothetical protein
VSCEAHCTAASTFSLSHFDRGALRQVLVFDEAGQRVGAPQAVSGCFVCSLDIDAASDLLLVGGEQLAAFRRAALVEGQAQSQLAPLAGCSFCTGYVDEEAQMLLQNSAWLPVHAGQSHTVCNAGVLCSTGSIMCSRSIRVKSN